MNFSELAHEVMAQRERDGIRGLDRELSRLRCHILTSDFASKDVTEITKRDIRDWHRAMAQKNALGPGRTRKLSRQTISRCASLVSVIIDEAVERELREANPCVDAAPKKCVDESDTQDKWAYLAIAEQRDLFACEVVPYEDRMMMRFSIGTGLRQGEFRHLELPDLVVDGDDPHVVVRIASRRKNGEKLPPKSGRRRTVPLFGDGLASAKEWLAQLPTYCPSNPEGLVFPTRSGRIRQQGKPLGKSSTTRQHYRAAGIQLRPHLHWHALRHTFATNLVSGALGRAWSLEEIQKLMGHSSIMITQRYAHMGEDAIKRAVREAVAALEPPKPTTVPPEVMPAPSEFVISRPAGFLARAFGRVKEAIRGVA